MVRPPKYRYFLAADHTRWGQLKMLLKMHRPVPRFPRVVQIQTRTGCNADCLFCPYGRTARTVPSGRMDDDLFARLVEECERHRVRRISPYLMNEPFVDTEILDRVSYIRKHAPSCRVCLTTNGAPLRPEVVDRMLDTKGVHRLYISVQGVEREAYEKTMRGPKLDRVIENVLYLHGEIRRRKLSRPRVTVTMVDTSFIDVSKALAFWAERGVEAKVTRLENRGGNIDVHSPHNGTGSHLAILPMKAYQHCTRLMRQAFVLHDGRVTLCCTDYHQTMILGDLRQQSLSDIWNGPHATALRRAFVLGDLSQNPLCHSCTIAERKTTE